VIARRSDSAPDHITPIDPSPLLGDWTNYQATSRNIASLTITLDEVLMLRIDGWGEAIASPFALTTAGGEAVAFRAAYDFDFANIAIFAYLNKRLLVADAYTTFHDGSGRSSYFVRDHFYLR
jgi:hypothetical protein